MLNETDTIAKSSIIGSVRYHGGIRVPVFLVEWASNGRTYYTVRSRSLFSRDYAIRGVAIRNAVRYFSHPSNAAIWSTAFVKAVS